MIYIIKRAEKTIKHKSIFFFFCILHRQTDKILNSINLLLKTKLFSNFEL